MISNTTIDDVKNRVDIVDVVSEFVSLKRSGQNYKALSPFTNEKTPSFYVVPSKGIFKDFSSGKGGDAITFVMEHEGFGYLEAIRYLAKKYGVEIVEETNPAYQTEQNEREALYIIMNYAQEYYSDLLVNHEEGRSIGLSYFRERGFSDKTITKFGLGFSLSDWDALYTTALGKGYSESILEKAGLIIKKDNNKVYDRFRGRVMFPVHNLSGKVIAFGGRILSKDKNQPKYINSPETEIYHKSQVLYGLFHAKNAIRKEEFCYLVEGYTDVISMHLAGVENVVASSGTALTEEQVGLVKRFTDNITVLFDGDAAGIKAALRGINLVLKGGLNVRVVLLPDGEDPDSYSRKLGSSGFQEYLKTHTKDFISFSIDLFAEDAANDPIRKAEAIREIVTSISLIPDPIKRSVYIQETSTLLKISEAVLLTELNKVLITERKKQTQERIKNEEKAPATPLVEPSPAGQLDVGQVVQNQEKEMIRLLLNYADSTLEEDVDLLTYFIAEFEELDFTNPTYKYIFECFTTSKQEGNLIDSSYFMGSAISDSVKSLVADLTLKKYYASSHWRDKYKIYFEDEKERIHENAHENVLRRKYRYVQKLIEENKEKIKTAEQLKDEKEIDVLIETLMRLKTADKELADQLGIVSGKY